MTIEILAIMGAILSQAAGLPQIYVLLKTKKARDVSLATFILIGISDLIMFPYFACKKDTVGLILTILGFFCVSILVFLTIKFRKGIR